jgi:hypothetical protein
MISWCCERGTEYLVADPFDIAGLDELIQTCCKSDAVEPAFCPRRPNETDPFAVLPTELCQMILDRLTRHEIANLRMVSPTYAQLPQVYFKRLVTTEMPWVWEVQDLAPRTVDWYKLWCKLSKADGGSWTDAEERQYAHNLSEKMRCRDIEKDLTKLRNAQARGRPLLTELRGLRNRRRIYGNINRMLDDIENLWDGIIGHE